MAKSEGRATWFKMMNHVGYTVDSIPDAAVGQGLKACFVYFETETVPELEPMAQVVFSTIKPYIDMAIKDYGQRRETNAENGKKGGRPKKPK